MILPGLLHEVLPRVEHREQCVVRQDVHAQAGIVGVLTVLDQMVFPEAGLRRGFDGDIVGGQGKGLGAGEVGDAGYGGVVLDGVEVDVCELWFGMLEIGRLRGGRRKGGCGVGVDHLEVVRGAGVYRVSPGPLN